MHAGGTCASAFPVRERGRDPVLVSCGDFLWTFMKVYIFLTHFYSKDQSCVSYLVWRIGNIFLPLCSLFCIPSFRLVYWSIMWLEYSFHPSKKILCYCIMLLIKFVWYKPLRDTIRYRHILYFISLSFRSPIYVILIGLVLNCDKKYFLTKFLDFRTYCLRVAHAWFSGQARICFCAKRFLL
jgi:hypothetical protein